MIRTTKPEKGNKYYITKARGGYSPCIDVSKQKDNNGVVDANLDVLANCVGFATGWFNENLELGECKYLGNTNAKSQIELAKKQGLEIAQYPQAGGCMVWTDGKWGHIECVTRVENDVAYNVSSAYGSYIFANRVRKRNAGGVNQWGFNSKQWKYLGCILPPKIDQPKSPQTSELISGETEITLGGKRYKITIQEISG